MSYNTYIACWFAFSTDDQRNQLAELRYEGQVQCNLCEDWFPEAMIVTVSLSDDDPLCDPCYIQEYG